MNLELKPMALVKPTSSKGDVSAGNLAVLGHVLGQSPQCWTGSRVHQAESQCEQTLNKKISA